MEPDLVPSESDSAVTPSPTSVLLVEDHAGSAKYVKSLLEALRTEEEGGPYVVDTVASLEQLAVRLEAYRATGHALDVILLDLILPNGAGLAVAQRTISLAPEVAIVVLTAMEDPVVIEAITALPPVWDYLVKRRFDLTQLRMAISHAKRRHELEKRFEVARGTLEEVRRLCTSGQQLLTLPSSAPPGGKS